MPYAIYDLHLSTHHHPDFGSFKKTRVEVVNDVVHYLIKDREVLKPLKPTTIESLEADLFLDISRLVNLMEDMDLKVMHILDEEAGAKVDTLLELLSSNDKMVKGLEYAENAAALLRLSRIQFGVERILNRRFSRQYVELDDTYRGNVDDELKLFYRQAFVFLFLYQTGYDDTQFDALFAKIPENAVL